MLRFFKKRPYLLFIFPGFLLYTLVVVYPLLAVLPNSLIKWSGFGKKTFVGWGNFTYLLTHAKLSEQITNVLVNNAIILVINLVIVNALIFLLAYLMYRKIPGSALFTVIIFAPHFLNPISIGFMQSLFFNPQLGILSKFLTAIGLDDWNPIGLIANPRYALIHLAIVSAWKGMGYTMLLYLANFNIVPKEMEEAALIDGANELQRLWYVDVPFMIPSITNVAVLVLIWSITGFDMVFAVGGISGGVNHSMDLMGLFLYRTAFSGDFQFNFVGLGSAISVVMLVITAFGAYNLIKFFRQYEIEY